MKFISNFLSVLGLPGGSVGSGEVMVGGAVGVGGVYARVGRLFDSVANDSN